MSLSDSDGGLPDVFFVSRFLGKFAPSSPQKSNCPFGVESINSLKALIKSVNITSMFPLCKLQLSIETAEIAKMLLDFCKTFVLLIFLKLYW